MKRWLVVVIIMIVTCLFSSLLVSKRGDSGIKDILATIQFQKYIMDYDVELLCSQEEDYNEMLLEKKQKYLDSLTNKSILFHNNDTNIFVVEVKKDFQFYIGTYKQRVIVKKVVQGDSSLKNKEISIIVTTGIGKKEDEKIFLGALAKNIMLPHNQYLVFCEELEISEYLEEPYFRTVNSVFSYLNLDNDYSVIMDDVNYHATYKDYQDSEFFVQNKKILNALIEIKHYIIEKNGCCTCLLRK